MKFFENDEISTASLKKVWIIINIANEHSASDRKHPTLLSNSNKTVQISFGCMSDSAQTKTMKCINILCSVLKAQSMSLYQII